MDAGVAVDLELSPAEEGARSASLEVATRSGLAGRVDLEGVGPAPPGATTA